MFPTPRIESGDQVVGYVNVPVTVDDNGTIYKCSLNAGLMVAETKDPREDNADTRKWGASAKWPLKSATDWCLCTLNAIPR